jgi:DHA1 family bicyclomycin/chloramphenicol resistance-like MFS transporter
MCFLILFYKKNRKNFMNLLPYLLMLALMSSCIELEISAPSFPSMMTYFGVSESIIGLTISMNLIGFCLAAIIYGPLSDSYGRRKVMLFGNGVLAIGAIMCVLAPTFQILLFARFIQGLGAATSAVVV